MHDSSLDGALGTVISDSVFYHKLLHLNPVKQEFLRSIPVSILLSSVLLNACLLEDGVKCAIGSSEECLLWLQMLSSWILPGAEPDFYAAGTRAAFL